MSRSERLRDMAATSIDVVAIMSFAMMRAAFAANADAPPSTLPVITMDMRMEAARARKNLRPTIPTVPDAGKREKRIAELRPQRRDSPLRELNLSDNEAREVRGVALAALPGPLMNISGVVTGCPCEEGPRCTDQVYVLVDRPTRMAGLQLSRIGDHWVIGPVQQWWLDRQDLESRRRTFPSPVAYLNAAEELLKSFPACSE